MWIIENQKDIDFIENQRALVGVFIDRNYNREKIDWLFQAREGFDQHAQDAWHLLIPVKKGYGVDTKIGPEQFGVQLSAAIIDKLGIAFPDLPCIVFRAKGDEFFFLKLGGKTKEQFYEEIGRVSDLARACKTASNANGQAFRDFVNGQVASHLRRRKLLSAARSALPALSGLLGSVIDIRELV